MLHRFICDMETIQKKVCLGQRVRYSRIERISTLIASSVISLFVYTDSSVIRLSLISVSFRRHRERRVSRISRIQPRLRNRGRNSETLLLTVLFFFFIRETMTYCLTDPRKLHLPDVIALLRRFLGGRRKLTHNDREGTRVPV